MKTFITPKYYNFFHPFIFQILFFFLCLTPPLISADAQVTWEIQVSKNPFSFQVIDPVQKKPLLESQGPLIIQSITGSVPYKKKPYLRWKPGNINETKSVDRILKSTVQNGWTIHELGDATQRPLAIFKYQNGNPTVLRVEELNPLPENEYQNSRISLRFKSDASDTYFGMGMRFNQCNHAGTRVTNWCNEVGENLPIVTQNGGDEGRDITYAPVPFFLNLKGDGGDRASSD